MTYEPPLLRYILHNFIKKLPKILPYAHQILQDKCSLQIFYEPALANSQALTKSTYNL